MFVSVNFFKLFQKSIVSVFHLQVDALHVAHRQGFEGEELELAEKHGFSGSC